MRKDSNQISSPTPTEQITKVTLNETQQGYVAAGNAMAFRFLKEMYEGENLILSPLSLQYALAMTANGASGETLQEIIDFLGYGDEGIDALLVNEEYKLLQSFKQTVQDNYYAAVDNMDFSDSEQVAARINDWAKRNTNGFIDKILDPKDLSPEAAAVTVVEIVPDSAAPPGEEPKIYYFTADHPFAFILAERTSGTILFEGAFTGK